MKTQRKRKYKKASAIIGRIRDLGQLLARAQFWLVGFRGSQKARQVPFHNRFVEVFFRCWHANKRGLVLTASEQSRADGKGNVEFFVAQVRDFLRWAQAENQSSAGSAGKKIQFHLSLTGVLDDVEAKASSIVSKSTAPVGMAV